MSERDLMRRSGRMQQSGGCNMKGTSTSTLRRVRGRCRAMREFPAGKWLQCDGMGERTSKQHRDMCSQHNLFVVALLPKRGHRRALVGIDGITPAALSAFGETSLYWSSSKYQTGYGFLLALRYTHQIFGYRCSHLQMIASQRHLYWTLSCIGGSFPGPNTWDS